MSDPAYRCQHDFENADGEQAACYECLAAEVKRVKKALADLVTGRVGSVFYGGKRDGVEQWSAIVAGKRVDPQPSLLEAILAGSEKVK